MLSKLGLIMYILIPIFVIATLVFLLFIIFPTFSVVTTFVIFIILIINWDKNKRLLQEKLSVEYLEYLNSMKGKNNIRSYEDYTKERHQEIDNLKRQERNKKIQEMNAEIKENFKKSIQRRTLFDDFLDGLKSHDLRTASTNRSGRRRKRQ